VSKIQQDRDKKAAGLGLKWGKSGGVTEGGFGVFEIVSHFIPTGYKRFSIRISLDFHKPLFYSRLQAIGWRF